MKIICETLDEYRDTLRRCSDAWHGNNCHHCPIKLSCGMRVSSDDDDVSQFIDMDEGLMVE